MEKITEVKYLGVTVDECLSWKSQVSNVCKNVAPKLALLRRLRSKLPVTVLENIYKIYIQPILEYCCTVWGYSSVENSTKIQHLQNWAARIISNNYDFVNTRGIDIVNSLGWPTFEQKRDYQISSLMFKIVGGNAPQHLLNNVIFSTDVNERITRNTEANNLYIPRANINLFKESLQFNGASIWNRLECNLRSSDNVQCFKREYKSLYWG